MTFRRYVLALLVLLPSTASSQEWTRFRGPNGSGLSESKLPAKWTEKDIAWKVELPGKGHSSPVLWGDRLFVTSAEKKSGTRYVICVDVVKGAIVWKKSFDSDSYRTHRKNTLASSTPTVDSERVYLTWATPDKHIAVALDHDGKLVWEQTLGKYKGNHGFAVSPILHEGLLVIPNDQDRGGSLLALDKTTGKIRWTIERKSGNATYSTPCVFQREGDEPEVIFTNWKHGITAVNPKTGKVTWELSCFEPSKKERAIASPVVAGDMVLGTCGFVSRQKHMVAVRPGDSDAGTKAAEVWRLERAVSYLPTPLVKDGYIYLCSEKGMATCLEAKTGKQVWQHRIEANFSASPVCAGDHIYCASENGDVYVLRASPKYEMLGRNTIGAAMFATPAIARGRLFFRTESGVVCVRGGS